MVANNDIREAARKHRVALWEIADYMGMQDSNFSKKLRKELPQEEKEKIFQIIKDICEKRSKIYA